MTEHFVSTYTKVATFQKVGAAKQGGNVASYFTTSDGRVVHAIAGPVDEQTFLREARWAVEVWKMALLEGKNEKTPRFRMMVGKAHFDRLVQENGVRLPRYGYGADAVSPMQMASLLDYYAARGAQSNAARVHLLLAAYTLPRLERIYGVVFEKILNERLSTAPVAQR
jgi:hypothetical protein